MNQEINNYEDKQANFEITLLLKKPKKVILKLCKIEIKN